MEVLNKSFSITQKGSDIFALASGDFNPVHVDPIAARRLLFGTSVIHGVNGLLKALDIVIGSINTPVKIKNLKVKFNGAIKHDYLVELKCNISNLDSLRIELFSLDKNYQTIDVSLAENNQTPDILSDNLCVSNIVADDLSFSDSTPNSNGNELELIWDSNRVKALFPNLFSNLPNNQIAILLGTTNIVGMKYPGLHSIYCGLKISFGAVNINNSSKLKYEVSKKDSRFSLIYLNISQEGIKGEIEALFRPSPIQQLDSNLIGRLSQQNEYKNQHALIIGGSRGIGEITAKLITAGGASSIITYVKGERDANRVAADIISNGGECETYMYNVLMPHFDVNELKNKSLITHVYYFASPLIEKTDNPIWSEKLFKKYIDYYVTGLANLLKFFVNIPEYRKNGIMIFIPSTIYIDELQNGFAEYITAKLAAESFINQFVIRYPTFQFHAPRLPRVMTDQTSGVARDEPLHVAKVIKDAISNI